ncbi:Alpha/beta hydrolase [uncultured Gammaproteobacteria bacterium]
MFMGWVAASKSRIDNRRGASLPGLVPGLRAPALSCFRLLLFGAALLVASCAGGPEGRRQAVADNAAKAGFDLHRFSAGKFVLTGYLRQRPAAAEALSVLTVYIEGDGYAWASRTQISTDPTPKEPVSFALAERDSGARVLYLGRPCQYTTAETGRNCDARYWSSHRFAAEVIESTSTAIDQAKQLAGAVTVEIIGYSGGGVVAALVAARRDDVARLVTVAAPLDHETWTRHHKVSPLSGSLSPMTELPRLALIPQRHIVGEDDNIVPALVVQSYLNRLQSPRATLTMAAGADHQCCWAEHWPMLKGKL